MNTDICNKICEFEPSYPLNNSDKEKIEYFLEQLFQQHKRNLTPRTKYLFWRAGSLIRVNHNTLTAYDILSIICECSKADGIIENADSCTMTELTEEELEKWLRHCIRDSKKAET